VQRLPLHCKKHFQINTDGVHYTQSAFFFAKGDIVNNTRALMNRLTYVTEHAPRCPMPYLVRMAGYGKGLTDKRPLSETADAYGYGLTEEEAFQGAMEMHASQQRVSRTQLSFAGVFAGV
jgi:hypothetical protein